MSIEPEAWPNAAIIDFASLLITAISAPLRWAIQKYRAQGAYPISVFHFMFSFINIKFYRLIKEEAKNFQVVNEDIDLERALRASQHAGMSHTALLLSLSFVT